MKAYLVLASCMLTACCHQEVKRPPLEDVVLVPKEEKVNIDESLLTKCSKLPLVEVRRYTEKEVLARDKVWIDMHEACRTNNALLIDTVRKAFNIPEAKQGSK